MKEQLINIISKEDIQIDIFEIKQLIKKYPYFEYLKLIYLREMKKRDKTLFYEELRVCSPYFSNRKFIYFFINNLKQKSSILGNSYETSVISTDYFAINNAFVSKKSLGQLARKLRKARLEKIAEKENIKQRINVEEYVKKLFEDSNYLEALKILKKINLNNSKKSVYFALQIKYLETILNFNA